MSIFDTFVKILPPLVIVGGWVVVYQLQALQARRKLLREEVEKTIEAVNELLDIAIRFHTTAYDESLKSSITLALTDIERRYSNFPRICTAKKSYLPNAANLEKVQVDPEYLINLRRSITIEHFDEKFEVELKHSDKKITIIRGAALDLMNAVDKVFIEALD